MDAICWLAVALCLALLVTLCVEQMAADERKRKAGGGRPDNHDAPGGKEAEGDDECAFLARGDRAPSLLYGDAGRASDGLFVDDDGEDDGEGKEAERAREHYYGDAPSQRKPKPWHAGSVPLLSDSYYEVPGRPLDPYLVNVSRDEAAQSKLYAIPDGLQNAGNNVLRASIEAAEPLPPKQIVPPELGPQRLLRSVWKGQAPTYFDARHNYFDPQPRLWATDLDELKYLRGLRLDVQYPEPISLRQNYIQLLTSGWRNRRSRYDRASPSNDLAHLTIQKFRQEVPSHTEW